MADPDPVILSTVYAHVLQSIHCLLLRSECSVNRFYFHTLSTRVKRITWHEMVEVSTVAYKAEVLECICVYVCDLFWPTHYPEATPIEW